MTLAVFAKYIIVTEVNVSPTELAPIIKNNNDRFDKYPKYIEEIKTLEVAKQAPKSAKVVRFNGVVEAIIPPYRLAPIESIDIDSIAPP